MDILDKQNKFIFIHIPKTAGESVVKALSKKSRKIQLAAAEGVHYPSKSNVNLLVSYNSIKRRFTQAIRSPQQTSEKIVNKLTNRLDPSSCQWLFLDKHSTAQEMKEVVGPEEWDNCNVFAFVRNPYDRVVSFYHHLRKPLYMDRKTLGRQYPEFLDSGFLEPAEACKAAMEYEFNEWVVRAYRDEEFEHYGWFDSQLTWLTDERGQVIVDFVGKYEELIDSWKTICNSIGISIELPKVNSSKRASYSSYYSQSSRQIIESKFEQDLTLYHYDF